LLADLGLGPESDSEELQIREDLAKALSREDPPWPPVRLILLAGNLTGDASRRAFQRVTELVGELRSWLPGAGDATVIAVPGPRDRSQPTADQGLKLRILRDWEEPDDDQVAAVRRRLFESHDSRLIRPLFAGWQRWAEEALNPSILRKSYFPGDGAAVLHHHGQRLGIVALSSAWRYVPAGLESRYPPLLDAAQLQAALIALDPERPGLDNLDLADRWLLLTHHGPASLSPASAFDQMIAPGDRFAAMLHAGRFSRSIAEAISGGSMRHRLQVGPLLPHEPGKGSFVVIGAIAGDGEIRLWPLTRYRREDGSRFGWDVSFGEEQVAGVIFGLTGAPTSANSRAGATAMADPALRHYLEWAREQCRSVNMVGVTGGDCHFDLDQIHVPLRLSGTRYSRELQVEPGFDGAGVDWAPEHDDREVLVQEILSRTTSATPHVLITGQPGSGKTTSLRKLQHLCLTAPESIPGLDAGAVPVFVRLRHFTRADGEGTMAGFVTRALERQSELALDPDLAESICSGPALLLLDGLDEIADPALRARFCGCLDSWLPAGPGQLRVVLSSRPAGLSSAVDPGRRFLSMEVRPLSDPEIVDLVRRWFAEATRKLPDAGKYSHRRRDRLLATLRTSAYSTQAWKVLTGNPLLLTLLCLLTLRGHRMPDSRAEFYGRCLEVLLERHGEGLEDAPVDPGQALPILRRLAFAMHRQRVADVSTVRLVEIISVPLRAAGEPCRPLQLLDWLHRHAGVLDSYGRRRFGFLHLGLQEYLTAVRLRDDPAELPSITAELSDPEDRWWHEPLLLLAHMAGRQVASALLAGLCRAPQPELPGLVDECLAAMSDVDLAPLREIAEDDQAADSRRRQARRLIAVHEPRPAETAQVEGGLLFICHHPAHARAARDLAGDLSGMGWSPWLAAEQVAPGGSWLDHLEQLYEATAAAVLVGPDSLPPWHDDDTVSCLRTLAGDGKPLVLVGLPGLCERPEPPPDLRGPWLAPEARSITDQLTAPTLLVTGQALLDEATGIRLLAIPGGTFRMGADDISDNERPIHLVRLSPFQLAETPVTNDQYGRFIGATDYREPNYWRDGRFSDPQQPVVGISWEDAREYCRWAASASGRPYTLPSEAQWEYAARGESSRTYPWGEDEPTPEHACYDLNGSTGKPAQVGAHPRGTGPFGTLDQAGLVWELCLDRWDSQAYKGREGCLTTDPLVTEIYGGSCVMRGGCWFYPAQRLHAAHRSRYPAAYRLDYLGFRVAVARASP
jgi:formylglycine-generating enzyme required for sulfatase activity